VAPVVPDNVQQRIGEVVFEDIGFDALSQVCSQSMVAPEDGAGIVIDSSYSNTYIVPFF
jgi:actin-related protein